MPPFWRWPIPRARIARHLKVLEGAGLIVRRVEGTKRPCRLSQAGLDGVDQWLALLRNALSKNYGRLDELLTTMKPGNEEEQP
jgi:DNA-binding transcriptional ArsR family regulator